MNITHLLLILFPTLWFAVVPSVAQTTTYSRPIENGKLVNALDANGQDIKNIGAATASGLTVRSTNGNGAELHFYTPAGATNRKDIRLITATDGSLWFQWYGDALGYEGIPFVLRPNSIGLQAPTTVSGPLRALDDLSVSGVLRAPGGSQLNNAALTNQVTLPNGQTLTGSSTVLTNGASAVLAALTVDGSAKIGTGTPLAIPGEAYALQTIAHNAPGGMVVGTDDSSQAGFLDLLSGTQFWHISNRGAGGSGRIGFYNYNGTSYSTELFSFLPDGKLGIGAVTPSTSLQVGSSVFINNLNTFGGGQINNPYVVLGPYSAAVGGDQAAGFNITNDDSGGIAIFRFGIISPGTGAMGEFGAAGSASAFLPGSVFFNTKAAYPFVWAIDGAEKVRLTTAGNLGVGTSTPSEKLTVQGNAKINGNITATGTLSFGASSVGTNTIVLYDDTALPDIKFGFGIRANELQSFISSDSGLNHFSWNMGLGGLQTSGVNELMRLSAGGLRVANNLTVASSSGDSMVRVDSPAANFAGFRILKDGQDAWTMATAPTTRDFIISRFDTGGNWVDNPLSVSKATGAVTTNNMQIQGTLSVSNHIELPNDTRRGLAATYGVFNSTYGIEQVSAAQTGDGSALRIIGSSWAPEQYIAFGRYTDETTFYEFGRFNFSGDLRLTKGLNARWTVTSSATTVTVGSRTMADTSGAAFTLTLPASPSVGDELEIRDAKYTWGTNVLTIARNGLKINGNTSDFSANVSGGKLTCVYIDAAYGWSIQ